MSFQIVYETLENDVDEVAELLGWDTFSVVCRRKDIRLFLETHPWDIGAYKAFTRSRLSTPSIASQIKEFATSAAVHVGNKLKHAEPDVVVARVAVCSACEFMRGDGRCSACGCFMKVKAQWELSHCKKDFWAK